MQPFFETNLLWNTARPSSIQRGLMFLAAIGIAASSAGCGSQPKAPETAVPVQAVTVQLGSIPVIATGEAVLMPLHQAVLAPKISAPIEKFYVQRGDRVHRGQLLALLENKDLAGAALGSKGQYEQAQAQYRTETLSAIPQEMKKAQHTLAQARDQMNLDKRIYESQEKLYQEGALPRRMAEQSKVAYEQAQTQYGILQRAYVALQKVNASAQLQAAEGQLNQAKGNYQKAAATLAYSEIRSPIDGYVTQRPLYEGEMANAGSPILTVMNTSVLIARAHLPQSLVQGMKIGAPAQVIVPGLPKPVPGTVSLISPALDAGSTTVEVWVKVDNKNGDLKAGTAVQVAITARTLKNVLLVPSAAVVEDAGNTWHVMVIGPDSIAHPRPVTIGVQAQNETQILSGLRPGERVVTVGAYAMDDGTKVNVVPPGASTVSAAGKETSGGGF
jgi:HlyD family secretion protein